MNNRNQEMGFTQVPNSMLQAVSRLRMSGTQHNLLLVIWRYTYGFHKSEHELSLSFLAVATGYDERNIQRALKELQKRNIIIQRTNKNKSRNISFNGDVSQWLGKDCKTKVTKEVVNNDNGNNENGQNRQKSIGETDKAAYGCSNIQEINKKNSKEINVFFESIWRLLPNQIGKGRVSWKQKVKLFEEVGCERLKQAIERFSSAVEGKDENFIPYGSTFLNGRYEDYLQPENELPEVQPIKINRIDSRLNKEMSTKSENTDYKQKKTLM